MAMKALHLICAASTLGLLAAAPACAQNAGSSALAQYQSGYGASRYTTARPSTGSTRDSKGNRLVVDGLIQQGASSYTSTTTGVGTGTTQSTTSTRTSLGSATAIGNSLNVVVQGNNNTVVVNSTQTNNGNVQASTSLNGSVNF